MPSNQQVEGGGWSMPIIPFSERQWREFERAKEEGTPWFGWVFRDGKWRRTDAE
jgi:hypothetical protein